MNIDKTFLDIRPEISLEFEGEKNPIELFMHSTLRPILKMQHEKIILLLEAAEGFKKEKCTTNVSSTNFNYLKEFFGKNSSTKQQLIGCVVGIFTRAELEFYLENRKDLTKRISEMIAVRYLSTFD